ncbi:hypothetical protein JCM3770_003461 [Rhodotorula araucariae]
MAAPTFPHELVLLVFEHLELLITEEEDRRDEAQRLALVCRSWTEPARSLAWSFISLDKGTEDPILAHLVAHPHLLEHIDSLQCLDGCTRLRRLSLPPCTSDSPYLDAIDKLPCPRSIQSLNLTVIATGTLEVARLVRCIGHIPALRELGLRIAVADAESIVDAEDRLPLLDVEELKVSFMALPGSPELQRLASGLLGSINRDKLSVLTINCYMADQTFCRGIDAFRNLKTLSILATSHEQVRDGLQDFVAVLPALGNLSELAITVGEPSPLERMQGGVGGYPVFAPVLLGEFAAALPPSIEEAHLQGVYFDEDDFDELSFPISSAQQWNLSDEGGEGPGLE